MKTATKIRFKIRKVSDIVKVHLYNLLPNRRGTFLWLEEGLCFLKARYHTRIRGVDIYLWMDDEITTEKSWLFAASFFVPCRKPVVIFHRKAFEYLTGPERESVVLHEIAHMLLHDFPNQKGLVTNTKMELEADNYVRRYGHAKPLKSALKKLKHLVISHWGPLDTSEVDLRIRRL